MRKVCNSSCAFFWNIHNKAEKTSISDTNNNIQLFILCINYYFHMQNIFQYLYGKHNILQSVPFELHKVWKKTLTNSVMQINYCLVCLNLTPALKLYQNEYVITLVQFQIQGKVAKLPKKESLHSDQSCSTAFHYELQFGIFLTKAHIIASKLKD